MTKNRKTSSYTIGFGKPPAGHRFKPGKSGNPSGRPAGVQNLTTRIGKKLAAKRSVVIAGSRVRMTLEDIILERLIERAVVKGDIRIIQYILGEAQKYRKIKARSKIQQPEITRADLEKMSEQERIALYRQKLKESNESYRRQQVRDQDDEFDDD